VGKERKKSGGNQSEVLEEGKEKGESGKGVNTLCPPKKKSESRKRRGDQLGTTRTVTVPERDVRKVPKRSWSTKV